MNRLKYAAAASLSMLMVLIVTMAVTPSAMAAAPGKAVWAGALPPAGRTLRITARANAVGGGVTLSFPDAAPKAASLKIAAGDMAEGSQHYQTSKLPNKGKDLKDALLNVRWNAGANGVSRLYFIRPDVHFYTGDDLKRALAKWNSFPPASKHIVTIELAAVGDTVDITIDGRHLTSAARHDLGTKVEAQLVKGGEVLTHDLHPSPATATVWPLDISHTRSQSDVKLSGLSLTAAGKAALAQARVQPVDLADYVDVGNSRWLWQANGSGGFYAPYDKRSAWDNLPERIIFSVPPAPYTQASFLVALRDDGGRQPVMTVRMARYNISWNGSGPTYGDTPVRLDPKSPSPGVSMKQVGSVRMATDSQAKATPVYLVTVPLRTGELAGGLIADKAEHGPIYGKTEAFSLELSRPFGQRRVTNYARFELRPVGPQSGVIVLGATLQRPTVTLMVRSAGDNLVFYRDKHPALEVAANNPTPQARQVTMNVDLADYDGKHHPLSQTFTVKPGRSSQRISLASLDNGWYQGRFTFTDSNGERLWTQRVAFVIQPPETRKATFEDSPYCIWIYKGSHYTEADPDKILAAVHELGFHRMSFPVDSSNKKDPQEALEKMRRYDIFPGMMSYFGSNLKTVKARTEKFHKNFPQIEWAMVFHETGGTEPANIVTSLPPELLSEKYPPRPDNNAKRFKKLWGEAEGYIRTVRQVAPNMKFMIGNGGTNFNVAWLRGKFPPKDIDALGMEMAVQLYHPEGQPNGWNLQSYWIARQMADRYGYKDLPVAGCIEVDYRSTAPGGISERMQADWYARDVLLGLAYRMPTIAVAVLDDSNDSYYYSRWGSSGVMERAPMMMPKPSFASLSTLTRVLDRAAFQRWLPTGSTVVQALEFKKPGGGYVYALWTSRGERQVALKDVTGKVTVVHSAGYSASQRGGDPIAVSGSPVYVVTSKRLAGIAALPAGRAPAAMRDMQVIGKPQGGGWRVAPHVDLKPWAGYTPLVKGRATLSDDGEGLTVTLTPKADLPALVSQYVTLEPAAGPLAIEGTPDSVGAWIDGNGNWGRVIFELIDAKGKHWISEGYDPGDWGLADWTADQSIDFDGWRLVTQPLPLRYPSGYYGLRYGDWHCTAGDKDTNVMAYPIKLSRIYLTFRQKLVHVNEMVDAKSLSIGIGDIVAGNTGDALVMEK